MFEQKLVFIAAIARVPAEEAEATGGKIRRYVVLGEVDIIVGGDESDLGTFAPWCPVYALARVTACLNARHGRRGKPNKLCVNLAA